MGRGVVKLVVKLTLNLILQNSLKSRWGRLHLSDAASPASISTQTRRQLRRRRRTGAPVTSQRCVCTMSDDRRPEGGHHFLIPNPTDHMQNCVLVSRRRLEGGRKKLTRGSLLRHQEKIRLRCPASVGDLRPHTSSQPRHRTCLSPPGPPPKPSPQPL